MTSVKETIQQDDWKKEKHIPVIDCPDEVAKDEFFKVTVTLGKAVAHPNKTEHHIRWIALYFLAEDKKQTMEVARFEFAAHGDGPGGPDSGTVYTHHEGCTQMKTGVAGTLQAMAYCNIHGLWQSSKEIKVK